MTLQFLQFQNSDDQFYKSNQYKRNMLLKSILASIVSAKYKVQSRCIQLHSALSGAANKKCKVKRRLEVQNVLQFAEAKAYLRLEFVFECQSEQSPVRMYNQSQFSLSIQESPSLSDKCQVRSRNRLLTMNM